MPGLAVSFARRKKISWYFSTAAALLFSLCVMLPFIADSLAIEFVSEREKQLFFNFQFIGTLATPAFVLGGLLLTATHWLDVLIRVLLVGLLTFLLYVVLVFYLFIGMCTWTTSEILFEQRADPSTVIALRGMGCGATDSGPPVYNTFKMTPLTSHFVRVVKLDTATLSHGQWRRVHRQPAQRF